jgi:hypothetical protein
MAAALYRMEMDNENDVRDVEITPNDLLPVTPRMTRCFLAARNGISIWALRMIFDMSDRVGRKA